MAALEIAAESLSKFMDAMLYSVNTHPKWWHLYKHAKKYRVRKKIPEAAHAAAH